VLVSLIPQRVISFERSSGNMEHKHGRGNIRLSSSRENDPGPARNQRFQRPRSVVD
jgi:hypothetical protein